MPRLGPIKRNDLIRHLRGLGFTGPQQSGRHAIMRKGDLTIRLPNPHRGDISRALLAEVLRQAGISRDEWERV